MEKRNKIITATPLIIIAILIIFFNKNKHVSAVKDINDTVPASSFVPNAKPNKANIDLGQITSITFPKYKIKKESVLTSDTISMSADEETIGNGNYSALLLLDTIPPKDLYARIEVAAQKDTCWKIQGKAFTYTKKDKLGGIYKVAFLKDNQQISVTHQTR